MFTTSDRFQKKVKIKVPVEVELDDGTLLMGSMFVGQQERISDVLNDERDYLPVETADGIVTSYRKTVMVRITELSQEHHHERSTSPYAILGVAESISDDELKQAYIAAVRENHPDRWAGAGLPPEARDALTVHMARINDAYHRIVKRRSTVGSGQVSE